MYMIASASAGTNRLVTGKPFSAEATTETVQMLADGNRIVRHNTTRYFRDSKGRTRREQSIESLGPSSPIAPARMIFISDAVAKIDYVLDPARKTLRKFGRLEIDTTGKLPESSRGEKQDLGKRMIEGLECTGTRQTKSIPAGSIGNDEPIITTAET